MKILESLSISLLFKFLEIDNVDIMVENRDTWLSNESESRGRNVNESTCPHVVDSHAVYLSSHVQAAIFIDSWLRVVHQRLMMYMVIAPLASLIR